MPVTAKLSRQFYDKFGDEIANELVEWFNLVDAQYKAELKDLADAYYGRFRGELRSEIANLRADMMKWMFVFWIGNVAATVGIVFTAIKLIQP